MESVESLEAQRVARELELLEERQALAREEEGWWQARAPLLHHAAAGRRERLEAAGVTLAGTETLSPAGLLERLERLAPVLEAAGARSGALARIVPILRQWKGVEAAMNARRGGAPGPSPEEGARRLPQGAEGPMDPMAVARDQKLDRQAAAFLRSLGIEAQEGEPMADALGRLRTGLTAERRAQVREKAARLLDEVAGAEGGPG